MTKDEALKLALDFLLSRRMGAEELIVEIQEALAQPAQEPVAWMRPSEEGYDSAFRDHSTVMACTGNPWTGWAPLYTTPPKRTWVDLTDEERSECKQSPSIADQHRAIETKRKEKNLD
jgi:hypothetical protein